MELERKNTTFTRNLNIIALSIRQREKA